MTETENGKTYREQQSTDDNSWIVQGNEMFNRGEVAKALEYYDQALQTTSSLTQARAWHNKANALDSIGKFDEAIRCYDSALTCDPNDAECWFNKGLTLKKIGREEEGAICVNKGVDIAIGR